MVVFTAGLYILMPFLAPSPKFQGFIFTIQQAISQYFNVNIKHSVLTYIPIREPIL